MKNIAYSSTWSLWRYSQLARGFSWEVY